VPGARAHYGDVSDALERLPAVSWFNGDFCGFGSRVLRAVEVASARALPGFVLALTWCRNNGCVADEVGSSREVGIDRLVRGRALTAGSALKLERIIAYHRRGGSPMAVGIWSKPKTKGES
jgi:hypothetical protein